MTAYVSPECSNQQCASCTDLACTHKHHGTIGWPARDLASGPDADLYRSAEGNVTAVPLGSDFSYGEGRPPRCATCNRDAHRSGWQGHYYQAPGAGPADDGQGDYLYTITCCGNDVDIRQGLEAHCPGCRSTFVVALERDPADPAGAAALAALRDYRAGAR